MTPEKIHDAHYFYEHLQSAFQTAAARREFNVESFGKIGDFDFNFYSPKIIDPAAKNILIAGGFHGEEPAGSWAIVHFLETATAEELNAANLFFMPLVNPTGFDNNRRHNDWDEDPNQGYGGGVKGSSREGKLMLENMDKITNAAAGGFLSLHEDSDMKKAYLWTNENGKDSPGPFTSGILESLSRHFSIFSGAIPHRDGEIEIKNGIGFNVMDDSFETLMIQKGIPRTATPETPAHPDVPVEQRIAAGRDAISSFIKLTA